MTEADPMPTRTDAHRSIREQSQPRTQETDCAQPGHQPSKRGRLRGWLREALFCESPSPRRQRWAALRELRRELIK
jgi:hypothetical protein